jgi:hypothetical protein
MKSFQASRGGAKPRMLSSGVDWAIEMGQGYEKSGVYEWSERFGELARRVELPHWLAQARQTMSPVAFKNALATGALRPPAQDIGESGGHIWLRPHPSHGWAGSAVGVDEVIFERAKALGAAFKSVRFVGYDPGYKLALQWRVSAQDFLAKAQRVQTKPQFMAQWMVSIADLSMVVSR